MARVCDYCGKHSDHGHKVSHAKNRTNTVRKPNLHVARVVEKGKVVRRKLCTKCLRKAQRPDKSVGAERKETKTVVKSETKKTE